MKNSKKNSKLFFKKLKIEENYQKLSKIIKNSKLLQIN